MAAVGMEDGEAAAGAGAAVGAGRAGDGVGADPAGAVAGAAIMVVFIATSESQVGRRLSSPILMPKPINKGRPDPAALIILGDLSRCQQM
jgi:hypothetical protein